MPRFLHTADWQIGRRYPRFEEEDAAALFETRFAAVERIARLAAEQPGAALHVPPRHLERLGRSRPRPAYPQSPSVTSLTDITNENKFYFEHLLAEVFANDICGLPQAFFRDLMPQWYATAPTARPRRKWTSWSRRCSISS